jgi:hypothetical protein
LLNSCTTFFFWQNGWWKRVVIVGSSSTTAVHDKRFGIICAGNRVTSMLASEPEPYIWPSIYFSCKYPSIIRNNDHSLRRCSSLVDALQKTVRDSCREQPRTLPGDFQSLLITVVVCIFLPYYILTFLDWFISWKRMR